MKKIVSILLAILMVLGVGGCSSMQEETGGRSEHRIGVAVYDVTDDEVTAFREYLTDYIKKCFPEVDFCYSYAIRSAEDEMKFLEDACAEGVEGIMSFITYDLAAEVDYCASKGIYYMLASGTVTDEAYEAVADEPYFLGVVGPGLEIERQAGADMAEYFINEMEGDSYILFTGGAAIGNEMHRMRSVGALEVFEKYFGDLGQSVEKLAVTEDAVKLTAGNIGLTVFPGYTTREDVEKRAVEELESTEYDLVLSMFSMYSMVDVLKKEGVKQGVIDCYSMTNKALFANGTLCYVAGKFGSTIGPSFAAMYNAVTGYGDEFRENGRAFQMTQGYWLSKNKKEYNDQYALATGIYVNAYDYEDLCSVMKVYDGKASFEKLKALAEAYTWKEAKVRRGE
ncbi:MAG: hypothetical protein HFH59_11265 [Lachnospiraceae bacterium]|nr:hypothetical protein [Lachnospiraceae bacterium]MCI9099893.1 hypothetical protein [Lachnospiraceae bacterium]MCI9358098.1 hypothetical protein [Lachnospiraceae bacterium]